MVKRVIKFMINFYKWKEIKQLRGKLTIIKR